MIEELQLGYYMRFAKIAAYRMKVWEILTREFFSRWIDPGDTVLDLGCGWGEFINQIRAGRKYGMDLNPESQAKLSPEVKFLHQDCSQQWEVPDEHLDVVFTSNFFEHLPDKAALSRTLSQALRCLKPGGRLICLGPNIKYLRGHYWDFWDHYLPLTELSLQEGCELAGFETERIIPQFLPFSMSQGHNPPLLFVRLFLRLPLAWRFMGKQFLIIMRKPAQPGASARPVARNG